MKDKILNILNKKSTISIIVILFTILLAVILDLSGCVEGKTGQSLGRVFGIIIIMEILGAIFGWGKKKDS